MDVDWRLKALNRLKVLKEPNWQNQTSPKIDYQIFIIILHLKVLQKPKV